MTSVGQMPMKNLSLISHCHLNIGLVSILLNARINSFYNCHAARTEVTMSYSSSVLLSQESCINSKETVWFSKCLQHSVFISLETVFRNQLISKKESLRGNVTADSFHRDGPHVTILQMKICTTYLRYARFFCFIRV
jgi:hypothetical protein